MKRSKGLFLLRVYPRGICCVFYNKATWLFLADLLYSYPAVTWHLRSISFARLCCFTAPFLTLPCCHRIPLDISLDFFLNPGTVKRD